MLRRIRHRLGRLPCAWEEMVNGREGGRPNACRRCCHADHFPYGLIRHRHLGMSTHDAAHVRSWEQAWPQALVEASGWELGLRVVTAQAARSAGGQKEWGEDALPVPLCRVGC